ncbi:helix-turn-helix domain-containing protein [bacterium]|nr:helix-turn-helix domain-containing protein [bacterium]
MDSKLYSEKVLLLVLKRLFFEVAQDLQENDRVLTIDEAADFLKVKVDTVKRLAFKKHELPYSKPGKNAVFLREDLLKFLEKRRIPSIHDEGV